MTAPDDLLALLGAAYDSLASGDVAPCLRLVATDALCVVTDEVELRQERMPLAAGVTRLGHLAASGHRFVGGPAPTADHSGDHVWATDLVTVVLPDGTSRSLQVTVLAKSDPDGSLLVEQVNLAAPARDRGAARLDPSD